MANWDTILKLEERPPISTIDLSPVLVARNKKRRSAYEDLVQLCPTMFAAINRRSKIEDKGNDHITDFFWASEKEPLLRAVYGDLNEPITVQKPPPNELLVTAGRFLYRELIEDAEAKKLNPWTYFIWSSIASATGIRLSIGRFDYYFACSQDESAEFKIWNDCQTVAIGFRPFKLGASIGG